MEYGLGLGIPTRGPIAERGSIEAAACAEAPGFSRLALLRAIPSRRVPAALRYPCPGPGSFPDSVRFVTMPIPISNASLSNASRVRLPRRMRPRGPRR